MSYYTAIKKYQRLNADPESSQQMISDQYHYCLYCLENESFDMLLSDLDDFIMDLSNLDIPKYVLKARFLIKVIYEIRRRYYELDIPFKKENEQNTEE